MTVHRAKTLRVAKKDVTCSTMASSEVAQYLVSPAAGGASHSLMVFLMLSVLGDLGSMEKRERMAGRTAEEKGMELAA